ncbi:MAG TPA: hypothetical protein VH500_09170 [Nitrososphaeraceae archaeon]|jgi:hypothetical protein
MSEDVNHEMKDFMSEEEIEDFFVKKSRLAETFKGNLAENTFYKWIKKGDPSGLTYDHMDPISNVTDQSGNSIFDCDTITDEWYKWFYTIPGSVSPGEHPSTFYGDTNRYGAFLFTKNDVKVYFAAVTPFQKPDIKTITITNKAPLLVPVYNMSASRESFPSKSDLELMQLVKDDLSGVRPASFWAKFDDYETDTGKKLYGCCVIRKTPLPIAIPNVRDNIFGIPEERLLKSEGFTHTFHGGYWLLIKESVLTPGEHLLQFNAESKNYEIQAKLHIRILY